MHNHVERGQIVSENACNIQLDNVWSGFQHLSG